MRFAGSRLEGYLGKGIDAGQMAQSADNIRTKEGVNNIEAQTKVGTTGIAAEVKIAAAEAGAATVAQVKLICSAESWAASARSAVQLLVSLAAVLQAIQEPLVMALVQVTQTIRGMLLPRTMNPDLFHLQAGVGMIWSLKINSK